MKRDVAVVEGSGSEKDKFNKKGESQMNEQSQAARSLVLGPIQHKPIEDLTRKAFLERKDRPYHCPHGKVRLLCLRCDGLSKSDIRQWDRIRTRERHISLSGRRSYSKTKISGSDCVLASSTGLYYCRHCDTMFEPDELTSRKSCPMCSEFVNSSGEFFQPIQFSLLVKTSTTSSRDMSALASYTDPSSGIQNAGTGRIRIPLDAPRETRPYPPEWLYDRRSFLETLKKSRALRGEQILVGFFVNKETDTQIAEALHWTKDAVKKERRDLVRRGNEFFKVRFAGRPPCPAISEGDETNE